MARARHRAEPSPACDTDDPARRGTAQERGTDLLARLEAAIGRGSAHDLLDHAADRVEIALFGVSSLYSRAQAVYVMQDFFRQYPPVRFVLQEPSRSDGNWFAGGSYAYAPAGRDLQVFVRIRKKDGGWELREVRVEQRSRD